MEIEDRLREDLRRSVRTATDADVLPETCGRRSSTASPAGTEASSFRSRPWRSRWPPPWITPLWLVIAFTGARDQFLLL
jgi:hypothetical protein